MLPIERHAWSPRCRWTVTCVLGEKLKSVPEALCSVLAVACYPIILFLRLLRGGFPSSSHRKLSPRLSCSLPVSMKRVYDEPAPQDARFSALRSRTTSS